MKLPWRWCRRQVVNGNDPFPRNECRWCFGFRVPLMFSWSQMTPEAKEEKLACVIFINDTIWYHSNFGWWHSTEVAAILLTQLPWLKSRLGHNFSFIAALFMDSKEIKPIYCLSRRFCKCSLLQRPELRTRKTSQQQFIFPCKSQLILPLKSFRGSY